MFTGGRGYWLVLTVMYMMYVVGLPMLYSMLLASRKKQLGGPKKAGASGEKKKKQ